MTPLPASGKITDSKDAEKEQIAEAMFRTAQCYFSKGSEDTNAFRTYRNVLEQFPLSEWGKRANAELLNDRMINVQQNAENVFNNGIRQENNMDDALWSMISAAGTVEKGILILLACFQWRSGAWCC